MIKKQRELFINIIRWHIIQYIFLMWLIIKKEKKMYILLYNKIMINLLMLNNDILIVLGWSLQY